MYVRSLFTPPLTTENTCTNIFIQRVLLAWICVRKSKLPDSNNILYTDSPHHPKGERLK